MLIQVFDFVIRPSHTIVIFFAIGAVLVCIRWLKTAGKVLIGIGVALFFIVGNGPFAYYLLGMLEHRYAPLKEITSGSNYESIAVLAGYGVSDDYFPPSSMVNDASLFRTVEAARLWHQSPSTVILLAGPKNGTLAMAALLQALRIPDKAIKRLTHTQSTSGNIESLLPWVKNTPFVLVTSAGHMPRAMWLCRQAGLSPIPAPTDYYTSPNPMKANWLPSPFNLKCSDLAFHELLALLYLKLNATPS